MTSINFEELLGRTFAAADPKASATDRAKFRVAWANYESAYPGQGDQPFLDVAEKLGFPNVRPMGPSTLHYVKASILTAKKRCKIGNGSGGEGGDQRVRDEGSTR